MYQYTGSNAQPTLTWDSTGARFTGDAGSGQYPLRIPQAFTGDYLFQLSTRIDRDSSTSAQWCSDASIGLFNTTYTSTSGWSWKWEHKQAESPHKIIVENPLFMATTSRMTWILRIVVKFYKSPYVADGGWITMHMYHEPSINLTRYRVTLGKEDWDAVGTQIGASPNGGNISIANTFSGTYYVGISGDDDTNSMYASAFRYIAL